MLRKLKKKLWNYIIPRIAEQLIKDKARKISKSKKELFKSFQSVGKYCTLRGGVWNVKSAEKIILGNNVHIDHNILMDGRGGITISNNVHIAENVSIISAYSNYKGSALPYDKSVIFKPVHIEENVWIDTGVYILPGVRIKNGAIIGKSVVVNRDIAEGEIVGCSKAEHVTYRNKNHYEELKRSYSYSNFHGDPLSLNEKSSFLSSYFNNRHKEIIFILGTGRSGSNAIVNVLNQNPKCKAFHEDIRQLIRISTKLAENPEKKEKYYNELKDIFKTKIWQASDNQVLVHSDQRLWNLIPFLQDYFPNAKFIHLKRNVLECVKSMHARKWYSENEYPDLFTHDWAKYRLQGDKIGVFSSSEWNNLKPIQKCTWYWFYINKQIENTLSELNENKTFTVNLEELEVKKMELAEFVCKDNFDYEIVKTNQVRKADRERYAKEQKDSSLILEIEKMMEYLKKKFS